jgi:divinyl protochlorophyllide a 8-vinyl-reductase
VSAVASAGAASGRIGPNAVTRIAQALEVGQPTGMTRRVFEAAGLGFWLVRPPEEMVEEGAVARLHASLIAELGEARARQISWEAGSLTGDYLLARRIPRLAQALLRALPRRLAARLLLAAISRHAWTFAGSGRFAYAFTPGLVLTIKGSPLCRLVRTDEPACAYFAATFERIFRAILDPRTRVTETACEAMGAPECVFTVEW